MVNGNGASPGLWIPPGAEVARKDLDPEVLSRSVVDAHPDKPIPNGSANFILWAMGGQSDGYPAWGTAPKARDRLLRAAWPSESMLAGAISTVAARNAALNWKINHESEQVAKAAADMLRNSNNGLGWESLVTQASIDMLTQDNGAFIEWVKEDPNRVDSPTVMLQHLDSQRCWQTGVPEFPVIYEDANGVMHVLKWYQVYHLLEMPAPQQFAVVGAFWRLQYCLAGDATVRMADGTTKRMRDVVRERDPGPVMALDATGQMSPARITNWYENPRNGREWVNLRGRLSSVGRGVKRRNSWMTADHPVLSPDGWRDAGDFQTGDPIVTEYPAPNERQIGLIVGTMLGDGSMPKAGVNARMTIGHAAKQREWLEIKASALAAFEPMLRTDEKRGVVHMQTLVQPAFTAIRENFYADGRKRLPRELVEEHFGPELLAAWYLDDGNVQYRQRSEGLRSRPPALPRASIGCSAMSWDDARWIADFLTAQGFEANVLRQGGTSDGPRLHFTVRGTAELFQTISPFVPASMRYKVPGPAASPYDETSWDLGKAERFIDEALVERDPNRSGETVYCIDVEESHNFVTAGIVVHNCAVTRILQYFKIMVSAATMDEERLTGQFVRAVHLLSGITTEEVVDAMAKATVAAQNDGLVRYMQPVMVGSINPDAKVGHDTIPLASLPENWSREELLKWYMICVSLGLLTDIQEFMPLPGGNLGTSSQSETLHLKSQGKGVGLFQNNWSRMTNAALPEGVEFEWDEIDIDADAVMATNSKTRAETRAAQITSGEITPEIARARALAQGDLSQEEFDALAQQEEELRRERELAARDALAQAQSQGQERRNPVQRRGATPNESSVEGEEGDTTGVKADERAGPDEARLELETDIAEEIHGGLGKVRRALRERLAAIAD